MTFHLFSPICIREFFIYKMLINTERTSESRLCQNVDPTTYHVKIEKTIVMDYRGFVIVSYEVTDYIERKGSPRGAVY